MEPESKKRRIDRASSSRISSPTAKNAIVSASTSTHISTVPVPTVHPRPHPGGIHFQVEQAKRRAVAQAQQEGCTANFKIFDSLYGNFLLPVVPTGAELNEQVHASNTTDHFN